jgi:hypothetical protein
MNHRARNRGGIVVVCALVCLLVASAIVMAMTQSALRWQRHVRLSHQMQQTDLLLDAGLLRAATQLKRSADYQGESWRPAAALDGFDRVEVAIRIDADPQDPQRRQVHVTATLGSGDGSAAGSRPTRRSHPFSFRLSDQPSDTGSRGSGPSGSPSPDLE